jgi:hypothetical protein
MIYILLKKVYIFNHSLAKLYLKNGSMIIIIK